MKTLDVARIASPLGEILLVAEGHELVGLLFTEPKERMPLHTAQFERTLGPFTERETPDPAGAATRLGRYFAGDLGALDEQPVNPHGTEFQRRVWRALRTIRAGETRGYGELAAANGAPTSSRAVGAANGSNPVSLFVPCHRVIAANGTLHGYGGGLERKRWLLEHEGVRLREARGERQRQLGGGARPRGRCAATGRPAAAPPAPGTGSARGSCRWSERVRVAGPWRSGRSRRSRAPDRTRPSRRRSRG